MKKIGNTFGKGIKIGMLSAALAMGAVGCKANVDEPGYDYVEETPLVTHYFARHRFVGNNIPDKDDDKEDKIAWRNAKYSEIKDYMLPKVQDFMTKVERENGGDNFLLPVCQRVFSYSNGEYGYPGFSGNLEGDLNFNNNAYSKLIGAISGEFIGSKAFKEGRESTYEEYKNFEAIYNALALRSYNDSLSDMQNDASFPFNGERDAINAAISKNQLGPDYTANPNDFNNLEDTLKKALQLVSSNTGVSMQTLTDAVNLALLNASLWGARDVVGVKANMRITANGALVNTDRSLEQLNTQTYSDRMYSAALSQANKYDKQLQQQQQQQENSR